MSIIDTASARGPWEGTAPYPRLLGPDILEFCTWWIRKSTTMYASCVRQHPSSFCDSTLLSDTLISLPHNMNIHAKWDKLKLQMASSQSSLGFGTNECQTNFIFRTLDFRIAAMRIGT